MKNSNKFKWYFFEDGHCCCVKGFSAQELKVETRKHGKVVKISLA